MKRILLFLLTLTTVAQAQVTLPDSTRQTGGTNFTPQFNSVGTNASTAKLQIYNPLTQKYFGLYSAYQQSQLFPTFNYFNTITGTSTLARINAKVDTGAVDVFLLIGTSNFGPYGTDTSLSVKITNKIALEYRVTGGGLLRTANDPVGIPDINSQTRGGSMWPAFAQTYFNHTGRRIVFISNYVGGGAQTSGADTGFGNFDVSGTLLPSAFAKADSGFAYLIANNYKPELKGVLIGLGEKDAEGINNALITQAQYETAFINMAARIRTKFGTNVPMYIWRTGYGISNNDAGFAAVQSSQETFVATQKNVVMANREASRFVDLGYVNPAPVDRIHLLQPGYNAWGDVGALGVVRNQKEAIWKYNVTGYPEYSFLKNGRSSIIFKNTSTNSTALTSYDVENENEGSNLTTSKIAQFGISGTAYSSSQLGANTLFVRSTVPVTGGIQLIAQGTNAPIKFNTNNAATPVGFWGNTGLVIGPATQTNKLDIYTSQNSAVRAQIYNDNTGTAASAEWSIANSTSQNDGLRLFTTGPNFAATGANFQDATVIESGTGASGGLGIVVRATGTAALRTYINGNATGNLRSTLTRTNFLLATTLTTQRTVGSTTDSIATIASDGTYGRVKTLSTSQIDTSGTGLATNSQLANYAKKGSANTFTGQQTFLTSGNSTAINGTTLGMYESNFTTKRPRIFFVDQATTRTFNLYAPDALTVSGRTQKFQDDDGDIALTKNIPTQLRLTGSGTGAATTISIPHGLSGVTSSSIAIVQPINAASAGVSYITTDATNVNIVYTVAPASGTNNLSYNVSIKP